VRIVFIFILLHMMLGDINKIARVNKLKKAAASAYANGDYATAISTFKTLTDSMGINDDAVLINLANAFYLTQDTSRAIQYYARVLGSDQANLRSSAYQQIGVILQQQNKLKEALNNFKLALKSDPGNEDARYNYELLKKILDEQQQQQEDENEDIKPSEYARKLKQQADNLAAQNMFAQALQIMQMGLKEDETVAAYNQFISKLNDVVESQQ
jgi:tetratricopeptide (TPR) repeat protein